MEPLQQLCSKPSDAHWVTMEDVVEHLFHLTRAVNTLIDAHNGNETRPIDAHNKQ